MPGSDGKETSAWWCLFRRLSFFVWQLVFAIDSREHYFIHRELGEKELLLNFQSPSQLVT